jgi:phosphoglycerate dehydrogenase-like enzyme
MRVVPVRRSPQASEQRGYEELPSLLPQADVLMITVPLTPETEGMIGEEQLQAMPHGSILINVARAQVVEERALYEALKSGKLHSAGLDVWYRYPQEQGNSVPSYFVAPPSAANTPPSEYPFFELPNLVMSPHRGGATIGTEERRIQHLATLIRAAMNGEPVPNQVNLDAGY